MNRYVKTLIASAIMVVISFAGVNAAKAVDCGELGADCFSRGYFGLTGGEASVQSDTLRNNFWAVDEDNAYGGFFFGYRMNKFFGLEALGNYFGEPLYTNGLAGPEMDARFCNIGVGANFYLPLGEVISDPNLNFISLFLRGGMHYWDSEVDDPTTAGPGFDPEYQDDGADPFYSFGLNMDLSRLIALRAHYTVYELGNTDEIGVKSLDILFKF